MSTTDPRDPMFNRVRVTRGKFGYTAMPFPTREVIAAEELRRATLATQPGQAEREQAARERHERDQAERERQDREQAERERVRLAAELREREKFDAHPLPGDPVGLRPIRMHPDELGDFTPGGGAIGEGYYVVRRSGSMRSYFRVSISPYGSGRLYALRLNADMYTGRLGARGAEKRKYPVELCWEYATPMSHCDWMHQIAKYGRLMTEEEFRAFGALYGVCVRCEQLLTRPESIKVGCGQVCAPFLGITYPRLAPEDDDSSADEH